MLTKRHSSSQRWLTMVGAGALLGGGIGAIAGTPLRAQVMWEPVTPKQAEEAQILVPAVDGGGPANTPESSRENSDPIVWQPVKEPASEARPNRPQPSAPATPQAVVWEPVPTDSTDDGTVAAPTTVVWEPLPSSDAIAEVEESTEVQIQVAEGDGSTETITIEESTTVLVDQRQESPPPEVLAIEREQPSRVPELPPPPPLQALNRSIAFGDGLVGPDIGWRVPNGFRWSRRWFGDAALTGQGQRNNPDDPFFDSRNADATAMFHINFLQTKSWSMAINTSIRSVNQDPDRQGGTTAIGEGSSSGFRIARQMGDTAGIAFGGEQVVQWDDKVDTGRNLYLMASKGWWLGAQGRDYPLLIANGGFGTGRFSNPDIQFGCVPVENKELAGNVDNELCWGPIGTISLVVNEWWGTFLEYRAGTAQLGMSVNLTGGIPLRLTGGLIFGEGNELQDANNLRWLFQASFGF